MNKVKLKLTYDELNAIHLYINEHIGSDLSGLSTQWSWAWRMTTALMDKWNEKLLIKLRYRKAKPITITLDMPTASAFMLFFGWDGQGEVNYLVSTVLKIQNEIDQQLCM